MCDGQLLVKSRQSVVTSWHRRHNLYKTIVIYTRHIYKEEVEEKLEPMIDYKYPAIASRATPIGSAGRAPDET
jgi:hypothetical protein